MSRTVINQRNSLDTRLDTNTFAATIFESKGSPKMLKKLTKVGEFSGSHEDDANRNDYSLSTYNGGVYVD